MSVRAVSTTPRPQAASANGDLTALRNRLSGVVDQAGVLLDKARKASYNLLGPQPEASATEPKNPPGSGFSQELLAEIIRLENTLSDMHGQLDRINEALL